VIRKPQKSLKGYAYFLTPSGRELAPLIEHLAGWGMRWTRGQLNDEELDVEFLMWDIQRRLNLDALPDGETVICFIFNELEKYKSWWLLVNDDGVDLCTENPGKEVDVYINTSVRSMVEVWRGDLEVRKALREQQLTSIGNPQLVRSLPD